MSTSLFLTDSEPSQLWSLAKMYQRSSHDTRNQWAMVNMANLP
jgi:hypothetical protein